MTIPTILATVFAFVTLATCESSSCSSSSLCTKSTTAGLLKGICGSTGFKVDQYLSIPYAEPPVGEKRFKQSSLYEGLGTSHDCKQLPPYCIQPVDLNMSEDCLYLNVYNPTETKHGKPVMVWIHGGSFFEGGSADAVFNGTDLAINEQVIVVTVNYRLGILGFYDSSAYGTNFGVNDVIVALQWIQQNAIVFGGDPLKVTVFGESSGGTMIRALLTSPLATGLFQRAIIQSDPQGYDANPQAVSRTELGPLIQELLSCASPSCVKSASIDSILQATVDVYSNIASIPGGNSAYPFGPNIDNHIVPCKFATSIKKGRLQNSNIDLMIGFNYNESNPLVSTELTSQLTSAQYDYLLAAAYGAVPASEIVLSGLFDQTTDYNDEFAYLATLWAWTCPTQSNIQQLVSHGLARSVYVYELAAGIEYVDNENSSLCGSGAVCHEDDLYLLWGTYDSDAVTSQQQTLSKEVQARWAQFAKTGSPNQKGYSTWKPAESASNLNIKLLGYDESTLKYSDLKQCQFIDSKVPYEWESS